MILPSESFTKKSNLKEQADETIEKLFEQKLKETGPKEAVVKTKNKNCKNQKRD